MTAADGCTTYLSCLPTPKAVVPSLPADVPRVHGALAATGFDATAFLWAVIVLVSVLLLGIVLVALGRRRSR